MASAGFIAGGLLRGAGRGLESVGKAKRDRVLEDLRHSRRQEERATDRDFQAGQSVLDRDFRAGESQSDREFRAGESGLDRTFRAGESQSDRDFRAGENALTRSHNRGLLSNTERFADQDGNMWTRDAGGVIEPVLGPDRVQLKGVPTGAKATARPSDIRAAEEYASWTAQAEGRPVTADDKRKAFDLIRQAKESPAAKAKLIANYYDSMSRDFRDSRSPEEKKKEAETTVDRWLSGDTEPPEAGARQGTGTIEPPPPGTGEARKPAAPKGKIGEKPPGGGTQAAPYQGTTQGHIDWFKATANPGDVITYGGKTYRLPR